MAYVYKITNIESSKIYIGLRVAHSKSPEEDLGHIYFTSSRDRVFKKDIKDHPEKYKWEIIGESSSKEDMYILEETMLRAIPEELRSNYYNRYFFNSGSFYDIDRMGSKNPRYGKSLRESLINKYGEEIGIKRYLETLEKISKANKGRHQSAEWVEKKSTASKKTWAAMSESERREKLKNTGVSKGNIPWNKGKKGSQVAWNRGKKGVQEAWNKGKCHSEETKKKLKEAWVARKAKKGRDN